MTPLYNRDEGGRFATKLARTACLPADRTKMEPIPVSNRKNPSEPPKNSVQYRKGTVTLQKSPLRNVRNSIFEKSARWLTCEKLIFEKSARWLTCEKLVFEKSARWLTCENSFLKNLHVGNSENSTFLKKFPRFCVSKTHF